MKEGALVWRSAFARGIAPAPVLTVSEWADLYRVLPPESAEPGQWRTERVPYMREIMDALSPRSGVQLVVLAKGSQIAGSEAINNWIGYTMDADPAAMLVVQPTKELSQLYARVRIDPMIDACERLRSRVREKRARDSGNTMTEKVFPGGFLRLVGANAASGLASIPVRKLAMDEIDRIPLDVEGEGDPVTLARARQMTFGTRAQAFLVSTPTIEGGSRIWSEFERTDQRYYFVPCPHCTHAQVLKWPGVRWERDDYEDPGHVAYLCAACGALIEESHKGEMLEAGEWRATRESANTAVRGYHLSALYSPLGFYSWRSAAMEFLKARKTNDATLLKAFVNTKLGECWHEIGEVPEWREIYNRSARAEYKAGTCPAGVLFLTAGVDVQKDRIECEVVGWGRDFVSWSVEYFVFVGDTAQRKGEDRTPSVWENLLELLNRTWPHASGGRLALRVMAIDSQYETQTVYNVVRRSDPQRVVAVRGEDKYPHVIGPPRRVDVTTRGKRAKRGMRQWPVGTNVAKGELYGWLRLKQPVASDGKLQPGYCFFPNYAEEYFRQLTAEQLVFKVVRGFRHGEWTKTRERNEALDCRVYARGAAGIVGADQWSDQRWKLEESRVGVDRSPPRRQTPTPVAPAAATSSEPNRSPDPVPRRAPRRRPLVDRDRWHLR